MNKLLNIRQSKNKTQNEASLAGKLGLVLKQP